MTKTCPSCSVTLDDDALFCSSCSTPLNQKVNCTSCNSEISIKFKFCKYCGAGTPSVSDNLNPSSRSFEIETTHNKYPESPTFLRNFEEQTQVASTPINTGSERYKLFGIVARALSLLLILCGSIYIFSLTGQIADLKDKLIAEEKSSKNLQEKLDKKDEKLSDKEEEISEKDSEIKDKEGTINIKDDELKKKKAIVAKQIKDIRYLKNNLTTVSTCFDGVRRGVTAINTENYLEAATAAKQMQTSCDKADKIIKKTAKYRTE